MIQVFVLSALDLNQFLFKKAIHIFVLPRFLLRLNARYYFHKLLLNRKFLFMRLLVAEEKRVFVSPKWVIVKLISICNINTMVWVG